MNLRRDRWLAGVLIFLSCTSVVRTQEPNPGISDIGLFTGFSNIASFGLGSLLGFFVKQCPVCSDENGTEPTPSLTCPDSFTAKTVGEKTRCYSYRSEDKTRKEASLICAGTVPMNARGRILGIETEEEMVAVKDFIDESSIQKEYIWMDATDYNGDDLYIWNKNGQTV